MSNTNQGRLKRLKNLIIVSTLSGVILVVSTYAWFVGLRSVGVSTFDIEIATTDSLLLSLDGEKWGYEVSLSKETLDEVSYSGHTNHWGGEGLVPISTIGEMDIGASRMMMYEKASYTATPGGYRVTASRVDNYKVIDTIDEVDVLKPEQDGYITFDLFVKNFTGTQYIVEENELDEEAIFLTVDSGVTAKLVGGLLGKDQNDNPISDDTGIQNAIRVAVTQIGRVTGFETNPAKITGISCNPTEVGEGEDATLTTGIVDGVTGLCRDAQIWEPNDRVHNANALSWYNYSCWKRTGNDITKVASYQDENNEKHACAQIIDGRSYSTYAISKPIAASDHVDLYDGPAYNSYPLGPSELSPDIPVSPLVAYDYFTDTMKLFVGTTRPTFMTLAPNSITKLRIYVFLEGQDIDNYNFASVGRRISVNFGFTKERFTEDDIDYDGPDVNQGEGPLGSDRTPPVITLNAAAEDSEGANVNPMVIEQGTTFEDPGATVTDNVSEGDDITLEITGTVDTSVAGDYYRIYTAIDEAGNIGTKLRKVTVMEAD